MNSTNKKTVKAKYRCILYLSTLFLSISIILSIIVSYFKIPKMIILIHNYNAHSTFNASTTSIDILLAINSMFFSINVFIMITIICSVLNKEKNDIKDNIFKDKSLFKFIYHNTYYQFPITQILFALHFLFESFSNFLFEFNIANNTILLIILGTYYSIIKSKYNSSFSVRICISFYESIQIAYILYKTLIEIYSYFSLKGIQIQVFIDISQSLVGIVLLSHYKDIFFMGMTVLMQMIVMSYVKMNDTHVNSIHYLLCFIMIELFCIIITVKNYKNEVIGMSNMDEDDNIKRLIDINQDIYKS